MNYFTESELSLGGQRRSTAQGPSRIARRERTTPHRRASMGARSSVGGAAGAVGTGFETRVLAWLACHLVARVRLPNPWHVDGELERVGSQTGEEMDDAGAVTSSRGYIFVQAKHHLSISGADHSPFAAAVDQAVRQYLAGAPSAPDGPRRPLEPGRDALVICTDTVPATRLATVMTRLADLPPELPVLHAARSEPERSLLATLLKHLDSAFQGHEGTLPSSQQLRDIIRIVRVVSLRLDSGGSDRISAETHLQGVLADPRDASGAWHSLVTFGQDLSEGQRWASRQEVVRALSEGGHPVGVDPGVREDVQRLREITEAIVRLNATEPTIPAPEGPISIHREVSGLVQATEGSFALVGEPGAGKSVLAAAIARSLLDAGEDVVFLRAEGLRDSVGATRSELNMRNNLDVVLRGWSGQGRATLIVDGVDATRGSGPTDWLPQLARYLGDTRWRVLATIRTYDLRHSPHWQGVFPGQPVDPLHADASVARVRHVLVGHFSDGELHHVKQHSPSLDALLRSSDPRLLGLLHNPFNLRLAAALLHDEGNRKELAAVRTRQDLLRLYWDHRVEEIPDGAVVIQELCEAMLADRRARIDEPYALLATGERTALAALLHAGVLLEDAQIRRLAVRPVGFSHPVLYDFAVALTCLGGADPLHLKLRLDRDPDLAITVRPSLDMHLADLWCDDDTRGPFWDLAIALSHRSDGHAIAAVAAACAALRESPAESDLMPLERSALMADDTSQAARRCIIHLAGALDAASLTALERETSAPALAHLAARLARSAVIAGDFGLADLARIVLHRIGNRFPLGEGSLEAAVRSRAVADVMRFALVDPAGPGRERLAFLVGDAVAHAAVLLPDEIGPVIDAMIAPSVMAVWGGRVVDRLLTQLGSIARVAPGVALRLARSVWNFEEPREQTTILMESNIRSFTSTRRQDLEMARYNTGEQFHSMLSAAPEAALSLFLSLLDSHAGAAELSRPSNPSPHVYRSHDLTMVGFGALATMEHAVINFITLAVSSDDAAMQSQADNMIHVIAERLTHHQVWGALLGAGTTRPASLGRHLLLWLGGGDLLGHYLVRAPAHALVAALSPVLTAEEHLELEAAVMRARDPLDSDEEHRQRLIDSLLSRLDRSCVQGAAAENRLGELDRQGGPQPVDRPVPPSIPGRFFSSGVRMMAAPGTPPSDADTAITDAMERLHTDLAQSRSTASHLGVRESLPALHALVTQGDPAVEENVFEVAFNVLVEGAEHLAGDEDVLPGTPLGDLVLGLLAKAAPKASSSGEDR